MDSFTLNAAQRAALQAAIARRAKAARLEHYRRQAELAATPDYFQWAEHARRFMMDLRRWRRACIAAGAYVVDCDPFSPTAGADPYNDSRGMAA